MFERMAGHSEYKEVLGREFMPACVTVANRHIAKPEVLRPALVC